MITVTLTGVEEIDKVLKGMPLQLTDKVLQAAHVAALKPTVEVAKLLAPEGPTGGLIDSIGTVKAPAKQLRSRELGAVSSGPRRGNRYKGQAAHLLEYGTVARVTRQGWNRGAITKNPFMEPAWERTQERVKGSINTEIGKKLYSFMRRTLK